MNPMSFLLIRRYVLTIIQYSNRARSSTSPMILFIFTIFVGTAHKSDAQTLVPDVSTRLAISIYTLNLPVADASPDEPTPAESSTSSGEAATKAIVTAIGESLFGSIEQTGAFKTYTPAELDDARVKLSNIVSDTLNTPQNKIKPTDDLSKKLMLYVAGNENPVGAYAASVQSAVNVAVAAIASQVRADPSKLLPVGISGADANTYKGLLTNIPTDWTLVAAAFASNAGRTSAAATLPALQASLSKVTRDAAPGIYQADRNAILAPASHAVKYESTTHDGYTPIFLKSDDISSKPAWTDWNHIQIGAEFSPEKGIGVNAFILVQCKSFRKAYLVYTPIDNSGDYDLTKSPQMRVLTRGEEQEYWNLLPYHTSAPTILDNDYLSFKRLYATVGFSPSGFKLGQTATTQTDASTTSYFGGISYALNPYAMLNFGVVTADGHKFRPSLGFSLDIDAITQIFSAK